MITSKADYLAGREAERNAILAMLKSRYAMLVPDHHPESLEVEWLIREIMNEQHINPNCR